MSLSPKQKEAVQQMVDALETALAGLEWYRDRNPDDVDDSDAEADTEIESALAAGRALLSDATPQEPPSGLNQWGKALTACPNADACNYHGCEGHCRPLEALLSDATPQEPPATCPRCNGNDANMPCAYPGERAPGCLRDKRLQASPPQGEAQPVKALEDCDAALLEVHDHLARALRIPSLPWPDPGAHGHEATGRAIHAAYCAVRFAVMDALASVTAARAALAASPHPAPRGPLTEEQRSDLRAGACVFRIPPYDKNPQSQRIAGLMVQIADGGSHDAS